MIKSKMHPIIEKYLKNKTIEGIFYDIYPDFDYYFENYSIMKNDSETECSHIFPVNYFSKWLSEEQKREVKKNKNKKTRDQKIKVILNEEEQDIKLHHLSSAKNIFPEELEQNLNFVYIKDKKVLTDKIEKLDKILMYMENDIFKKDFYMVFDYEEKKQFNNIKFNENNEINEKYKEHIINELKGISEEEIITYMTLMKAKRDFYILCEEDLSKTVGNVIDKILKNKPKFINAINYIFSKFTLMCFLIKFTEQFTEMQENEYIAYYLGLEQYIINTYKLDSKKHEKLIIKFLKKLKENILTQSLNNSYLYATINMHYIYDSYNDYRNKDENLSYLVFNTDIKMITSEIPIIKTNYYNMGLGGLKEMLKKANIKIDNDSVWLNNYASNTVIISANSHVLNLIFKMIEDSKEIFINHINNLIQEQSEHNNLMLIK